MTRKGRPIAIIGGATDPEDIERLVLAHTRRFGSVLDAAERRIAETGGIPHDELWSAVERPDASAAPRVAGKKSRYRPRTPRSSPGPRTR